MKVRFLKVLATRSFMCPFLWITWPKLAISIDTYIWVMRSPKRKSQIIWLNFWLFRHWHLFENQEKFSCFIKSPCLEILPVAWNFILMFWSLVPWSLAHIIVCSLFLDAFNSSRSLLHLLPVCCALIERGRRES